MISRLLILLVKERVIISMGFLNLVSRVRDEHAELLNENDSQQNNQNSVVESVEHSPLSDYRRLTLYISHKNDLVTFGYVNSNLVWFSFTKTSDLLSTRRIFDTLKVGSFFRKTTINEVLPLVGMTMNDIRGMCRIDVDDVSKAHPVISGCVQVTMSDDNDKSFTGVDFAEFIDVLPNRLKSNIGNVGTFEDIMSALNKDFDTLESLYDSDSEYNDIAYKQAAVICNKWRGVSCLNMSDRASLRSLYKSVCYHSAFLRTKSVVEESVPLTEERTDE